MDHATRKRFIVVCLRQGMAEENAAVAWRNLVNRYSEKHRRYHNLNHLDWMFSWLDRSQVKE